MVTSNITCPLTISRGVNIAALSPTDMTAAMQYRKIVAEIPYIKNKNTLAANKYKNYSMLKTRSEEHTSELQSHSDLVCRLLLEKKKHKKKKKKHRKNNYTNQRN